MLHFYTHWKAVILYIMRTVCFFEQTYFCQSETLATEVKNRIPSVFSKIQISFNVPVKVQHKITILLIMYYALELCSIQRVFIVNNIKN